MTGTPGFPPGLIFIGWGADFTTPVAQHYNLARAAAGRRELGARGRPTSARAASNLPIFMEVNPTIAGPVAGAGGAGRACCRRSAWCGRPSRRRESWYDSLQASARMLPVARPERCSRRTRWAHAIDHVSGLNIGGEARPMLPVDASATRPSIDAALAREKGDALFDARHRFVLSFGYELPRLDGSRRRDAAHRSAAGRLNGIIQAQTGFPLTVIEPTDVALTSLTNRPNMTCDPNEGGAAHDRAVVQHALLPAADAGGKRRPGRQRAAQRRPRPGLQAHRPVAVQELRTRRAASRSSCGSRLQPVQPGALRPAGQHARRRDLRRDHRGGRRPDRAAGDQVHVLRTGLGCSGAAVRGSRRGTRSASA